MASDAQYAATSQDRSWTVAALFMPRMFAASVARLINLLRSDEILALDWLAAVVTNMLILKRAALV